MNEYSYEIWVPQPSSISRWKHQDTKNITAYTPQDAEKKAMEYCNNHYMRYNVKNIKLMKEFKNPDGEI